MPEPRPEVVDLCADAKQLLFSGQKAKRELSDVNLPDAGQAVALADEVPKNPAR